MVILHSYVSLPQGKWLVDDDYMDVYWDFMGYLYHGYVSLPGWVYLFDSCWSSSKTRSKRPASGHDHHAAVEVNLNTVYSAWRRTAKDS